MTLRLRKKINNNGDFRKKNKCVHSVTDRRRTDVKKHMKMHNFRVNALTVSVLIGLEMDIKRDIR